MNIHYKSQILFVLVTFSFFAMCSQTATFQDKFTRYCDCTIIPRTNLNFKEYYEITFQQTLNHSKSKDKFNQRIYIGFQDFNAPTIMVTDGYAIDYASRSDYTNELAKELKANIIV